MARVVLRVGAGVWLLAGLVGLAVAVFAADAVARLLPPLAIDTDALAGAITAVSVALLLIGFFHVVTVAGLRSGAGWAPTLAVLLTVGLAVLLGVLAVASFTSAAVEAASAVALIGAGGASLLAGLVYGLAAARLVAARRSGSVR